jgi:gliding motility-associated-like protein
MSKYNFLIFGLLGWSICCAQDPVDIKCFAEDELYWENVDNTPCVFVEHEIFYSSDVDGPYQSAGLVTDPTQEIFDFVNLPLGEVFFYLSSTYDCGISTIVDSDTISSLPPDLVEISFLDVNEFGISINWNDLLNDINDHGYVIYRSTPSGVNPIATVFNTNEYFDASIAPITQAESYYVLALDDCGNLSIFDTPQSSMFLKADFNYCINAFNLSWYLMEDAETVLDSLKLNVIYESGLSDLIPIDLASGWIPYEVLNGSGEYCFELFAYYSSGDIATSNEICEFINVPPQLESYQILNVSVSGNSTIVDWLIFDEQALVQSELVGYDYLGNGLVSTGLSPYSIGDNWYTEDVEIASGLVFYEMNFRNTCDSMFRTELFSNLYLEMESTGTDMLLFNWDNSYPNYVTPEEYSLYKVTFAGDVLIGYFDSMTSSAVYELDSDDVRSSGLEFEIRRTAKVETSSFGQIEIVSVSNRLEYIPGLRIVLPNALSPSGKNNEFRPVLVSGVVKSYVMEIYDRYGKKLFESTEFSEGWKGKMGLDYFPSGSYQYAIKVYDVQGVEYEYAGMVALVR